MADRFDVKKTNLYDNAKNHLALPTGKIKC